MHFARFALARQHKETLSQRSGERTLTSPKILSFGKTQIHLVFRSLIRNFGFTEDRLHLGNEKKIKISFCISLDLHLLWLRRKYFRSEKLKYIWFFAHLFVSLQNDEEG
jgi:hypothetical protein